MARRATLIDSLRAGNPNTLVLDAGDFSTNIPTIGTPKSDFLFRMMGRMGYDAVSFGERELKFGDGHFRFPDEHLPQILMTNIMNRKNGELVPAAETTLIRDLGGVRVGLFALEDPSIAEAVVDDVPTYAFLDPIEVTEMTLATFREQNVDVVVLLSQLDRAMADSVLTRFPEIDVAVMGHRNTYRQIRDEKYPTTLVVDPGRRGQHLTQISLVVDPEGTIVDHSVQDIAVVTEIKPDPAVLSLVNEVKDEITAAQREEQLARQLEYKNRQLTDRYVGGEICARCHLPEHVSWTGSAHANAFKLLADLGMDASSECLDCHTVGHGEPTGFENPRIEPDLSGVQCESCHKMGSDHVMERGEKEKVGRALCVTCHDKENSPDFDFVSYMEKIKHWKD